MVEIQINIVEYIEKAYTFLSKGFQSFNSDLEEFFDELERDPNVCKSGNKTYKPGELWKDAAGKWNICKEGGVVEYDITPCSFMDFT